jgi:hypothetical protein
MFVARQPVAEVLISCGRWDSGEWIR